MAKPKSKPRPKPKYASREEFRRSADYVLKRFDSALKYLSER